MFRNAGPRQSDRLCCSLLKCVWSLTYASLWCKEAPSRFLSRLLVLRFSPRFSASLNSANVVRERLAVGTQAQQQGHGKCRMPSTSERRLSRDSSFANRADLRVGVVAGKST